MFKGHKEGSKVRRLEGTELGRMKGTEKVTKDGEWVGKKDS